MLSVLCDADYKVMLSHVVFLLKKKSFTHRYKAWRQVGQCSQDYKETHQRSHSSV